MDIKVDEISKIIRQRIDPRSLNTKKSGREQRERWQKWWRENKATFPLP